MAEILAEVEARDRADDEKYGCDKRGDELPKELANAGERVARIEKVLAAVDEDAKDGLRVSSTDPEAGFMHSSSGSIPAHNAQVAVTEGQCIVSANVATEPIGTDQLEPAPAGVAQCASEA